MIAARTVDDDQPFIAANPMFGMHNQITRFKRADFTQNHHHGPVLIVGVTAVGQRCQARQIPECDQFETRFPMAIA